MSPNLTSISVGSTNITSRVAFGSAYSVTADRWLTLVVSLTGLNGAATTITPDVVVTRSSNAIEFSDVRYSVSKRDSTATRVQITVGPFRVLNSDSVQVYLASTNASDTAVSGTVYVDDARYANVDIINVNGDATAPGNLALMYNGTGYAGGTALLNVNLSKWVGSTPNGLSSSNVPVDVKAINTSTNAAAVLGRLYGQGRAGTLQGGTTTTIQFDAGAAAVADSYKGWFIMITTGSDALFVRRVTAYASDRTATLDTALPATADNTMSYVAWPAGSVDIGSWLNVAPNALNSGNVQVDLQTVKTQAVSASGTVTFPNGTIVATSNLPANFSTLSITNSQTIGTSTLTQAQVTGGAYALQTDGSGYVKVSNGTGTGQVSLASGAVTAGTVSDKTGYTLTQAFPTNFSSLGITAAGKISEVVLVDTLTTYTNNTPQTGDAYARIGANGAALTALGDTRIAHLDADISSRMATFTVPASFAAANFAYLDAAVSSRGTYSGGNITGNLSGSVGSVTGNVGGSVASVTNAVTVGTNNDKTGYALSTAGVTAVQSGLSTLTAAQVWASGTRTLSSLSGLTIDANLVSIASAPVAVDTGTAGTISFYSGAYVMAAGGIVQANITQVDGENVVSDSNGRIEAVLSAAYDAAKYAASQESVDALGTVGDSAKIDAIKRQTDKITTGQMNIVSPYANGTITIKQGDSYSTLAGQTIDIPEPSGSQWPDDLTGWTVTLTGQKGADNDNAGTATFSTAVTVISPASAPRTLRLASISPSDTQELAAGAWVFSIAATSESLVNTLLSGLLTIVDEVRA